VRDQRSNLKNDPDILKKIDDAEAVISIAPSTSTVSMSMYAVMNNTTGEDILIHQSEAIKAQTTKV
jgi:hypothetical protein